MNNVQKLEDLFTKVTRRPALIEQQTEKRVIGNAPKLDYLEDEIHPWFKLDYSVLIEKKEKQTLILPG